METSDLIVIGAGISGMTFAHAAAQLGRQVVVLERGTAAGGCLSTHRPGPGFWVELGAHTCYRSYQALLGVIEQTSGLGRLLRRARVPFRLLVDGEVRSIPGQIDWLELVRSAPRLLTAKKQGRTVAGYYAPIVGAHNYRRLFRPLFAAVPSQPADELPADMLFKRRRHRPDVPRSFTVAGGLQSIVEALAARPGIRLRTGCAAAALRRGAGGFVVTTADSGSFEAAAVALATPPAAAASLVEQDFPELGAALRSIRGTSVATTAIVVRREALRTRPFAGLIATDDCFFSAVSRDTVPHPFYRGFAFHFRPGVPEPDRLRRMCAVLGIAPAAAEHVVSRTAELPSPRLGHRSITAAIDRAIAARRIFVTGNYFGGMAIEDCVLRSLSEATRLGR